jgi:hypothetical protein
MLVLKPGVQGSNITGTPSVPGLYIRFRDGIVDVKDEEIIKMMKESEGFRNGDFIAADESGRDPFAEERVPIEPVHVISEMKYGHLEGRKVSETPVKVPASVKKLIEIEAQKMAKEMVKEMLPSLLKEAMKEVSPAPKASKIVREEVVVDGGEDE